MYATFDKEYIEKRNFFGTRGSYTERKRHYLCNKPQNHLDKEELIYMLIYHDYSKTLIKKYRHLLSNDDKQKWLKLRKEFKYGNNQNAQFWNELFFYVLFPFNSQPDLHKPSIQNQILLHLESINHKHSKFRKKAIWVIEILTPYLKDLEQNFRFRLLDALIEKTNQENIKWIDKLIYKNIESIHKNNLKAYLCLTIDSNLMSPKAILKYLKYREFLDSELVYKLKKKALLDFSESIINNKVNTSI